MADENTVIETAEPMPPVYEESNGKGSNQRTAQTDVDAPEIPPEEPKKPTEESKEDVPSDEPKTVTLTQEQQQQQQQYQDAIQELQSNIQNDNTFSPEQKAALDAALNAALEISNNPSFMTEFGDVAQDLTNNLSNGDATIGDLTASLEAALEYNPELATTFEPVLNMDPELSLNPSAEVQTNVETVTDVEATIGDISQQLGDLSQNQRAQQQLGDFINNQKVTGPEQTVGDFVSNNSVALEQSPELKAALDAVLEQNPNMTMGDMTQSLGDQQQQIAATLADLANVDQNASIQDLVHDIETKIEADPNISNDIKSEFQQQIDGFRNSADNNFEDTLKNFGNSNNQNQNDNQSSAVAETGDVTVNGGDINNEINGGDVVVNNEINDGDVVVNEGNVTVNTGETVVNEGDINTGDVNITEGDLEINVPISIQMPDKDSGLSAEEMAFYERMAVMQVDFYNKVVETITEQNDKSQERLTAVYEDYIESLKESTKEAADKNINMTIINGDGNVVTSNIGEMTTEDIISEYGDVSTQVIENTPPEHTGSELTDPSELTDGGTRSVVINTPVGPLPPRPVVIVDNNINITNEKEDHSSDLSAKSEADASATADADAKAEVKTETKTEVKIDSSEKADTSDEKEEEGGKSYKATVITETESKTTKLGRFVQTMCNIAAAAGFPVAGMAKHLGIEKELEDIGVKIPGKDYSETYENSEDQKTDEALIKAGWEKEDFVKANDKTYTNGEYAAAIKKSITETEVSGKHSESIVFTDEEFANFSTEAKYELKKREFETVQDYYSDEFDALVAGAKDFESLSKEKVDEFKEKCNMNNIDYDKIKDALSNGKDLDLAAIKDQYVKARTESAYKKTLGKDINYDTYLDDISSEKEDFGKSSKSYTEIVKELEDQFSKVSPSYEEGEHVFPDEELVYENMEKLYDAGAFKSEGIDEVNDLIAEVENANGNAEVLAKALSSDPRTYSDCLDLSHEEFAKLKNDSEYAKQLAQKLIDTDEKSLKKELTVNYEICNLRDTAQFSYLPDIGGNHQIKSVQEYLNLKESNQINVMERLDRSAGIDYVSEGITDDGDISVYESAMQKKIELLSIASETKIKAFSDEHTKSIMYTDKEFENLSENSRNLVLQTEHQIIENIEKSTQKDVQIQGADTLTKSIEEYSSDVDYGKQSESYQVYVKSHTLDVDATMEKIKYGEYSEYDSKNFSDIIKTVTEADSIKDLAQKIVETHDYIAQQEGYIKTIGIEAIDSVKDMVTEELKNRIDSADYAEDIKEGYREVVEILEGDKEDTSVELGD